MYPDLVLYSPERGRKLQGTVEVETGESVNTLEAMAEWGPVRPLARALLVSTCRPTRSTRRGGCARSTRSSSPKSGPITPPLDQVRFTLVHRAPESQAPRPKAVRTEKKAAPAEKKAAEKKAADKKAADRKPAAKPASKAAAKKPAKPAKAAKPVQGAKKSAPAKGAKAKRR